MREARRAGIHPASVPMPARMMAATTYVTGPLPGARTGRREKLRRHHRRRDPEPEADGDPDPNQQSHDASAAALGLLFARWGSQLLLRQLSRSTTRVFLDLGWTGVGSPSRRWSPSPRRCSSAWRRRSARHGSRRRRTCRSRRVWSRRPRSASASGRPVARLRC